MAVAVAEAEAEAEAETGAEAVAVAVAAADTGALGVVCGVSAHAARATKSADNTRRGDNMALFLSRHGRGEHHPPRKYLGIQLTT